MLKRIKHQAGYTALSHGSSHCMTRVSRTSRVLSKLNTGLPYRPTNLQWVWSRRWGGPVWGGLRFLGSFRSLMSFGLWCEAGQFGMIWSHFRSWESGTFFQSYWPWNCWKTTCFGSWSIVSGNPKRQSECPSPASIGRSLAEYYGSGQWSSKRSPHTDLIQSNAQAFSCSTSQECLQSLLLRWQYRLCCPSQDTEPWCPSHFIFPSWTKTTSWFD